MSYMSPIQGYNNLNNLQGGTPLYNYSYQQPVVQNTQQSNISAQPNVQPIYQYPVTSLYNPAQMPQQASGVNINIYNPSGLGQNGLPSGGNMYSQPVTNNAVMNNQPVQQPAAQTLQTNEAAPIANTSISNQTEEPKKDQKTKQVVELTDDYIKTLENYLRSNDANVRRSGINQVINRFEEDKSRYDDPALTALLNIALQDPDETNRLLAMSPIASGSAHGDENSVKLLQNLQSSDKIYGQEAKMANEALLNTAQNKVSVPDDSPQETNEEKK